MDNYTIYPIIPNILVIMYGEDVGLAHHVQLLLGT